MPYRSSDLLSSGQEGRELVAAAASRVPNSTNNVTVGNDSMLRVLRQPTWRVRIIVPIHPEHAVGQQRALCTKRRRRSWGY